MKVQGQYRGNIDRNIEKCNVTSVLRNYIGSVAYVTSGIKELHELQRGWESLTRFGGWAATLSTTRESTNNRSMLTVKHR